MGIFKRTPKAPTSTPYVPRPIAELRDVAEPAWPDLLQVISESKREVEVLPVDVEVGEQTLYRIQITARSPMGAVALNSGGILLDGGWLRVLGGSEIPMMNMASVNELAIKPNGQTVPNFIFALDVLGGIYRVAGVGPHAGKVQYCGADMLEWETYDIGYGSFLQHLITEGFDAAYDDLRWVRWREDAASLALDSSINVVPPLFTQESRPVENASRAVVPMQELLELHKAIEASPLFSQGLA